MLAGVAQREEQLVYPEDAISNIAACKEVIIKSKYMNDFLDAVLLVAGLAVVVYYVPFLTRLGWNHAENRTKKVCDMCFREIKKFDDYNKKNNN